VSCGGLTPRAPQQGGRPRGGPQPPRHRGAARRGSAPLPLPPPLLPLPGEAPATPPHPTPPTHRMLPFSLIKMNDNLARDSRKEWRRGGRTEKARLARRGRRRGRSSSSSSRDPGPGPGASDKSEKNCDRLQRLLGHSRTASVLAVRGTREGAAHPRERLPRRGPPAPSARAPAPPPCGLFGAFRVARPPRPPPPPRHSSGDAGHVACHACHA